MNSTSIPVLKRRSPTIIYYLMAIPFYLILMPLNWLLKISGRPETLMSFIGKKVFKPEKTEKFLPIIRPMKAIFLSAPSQKSGTNWMMQITHQVAWLGEGEFENIHDVVCWPDVSRKRSEKYSTPLKSDLIKTLSPTGMRVIKTHMSALYVPYNEKAKYIIVVRDPKEVFVSSYPFVQGIAGPLMPSVDTWLELFLKPEWPMNFGNTWAEHTASYWSLKDQPSVLVLSYTHLKQDMKTGITQVADTLGVDLTERQLQNVLEKSSFQYMKNINHKFRPGDMSAMPWSSGFTMIREGKTGNSSELLSPQQQQRIDAHFRQELSELKSDFPYDEFFSL